MTQMQAANQDTERVSDVPLAAIAAEPRKKEQPSTATKKTASNANKDIKLDYLMSEAWIDREPKYLRI